MKFTFKRAKLNIYNLMRRSGYLPRGTDEKTGQWIFERPLSPSGYPRFHIYIKSDKATGQTTINLHLDQKRPSYKGTPAHGGEYTGEVVKREINRIKEILKQESRGL